MRPELFFLAASSRRFWVQSSESQLGKVSAAKASSFPSRETTKESTSMGDLVTCTASPPSTAMRHTWLCPERVERKKTDLPSGAQAASESFSGWVVSWRRPLPSVPTRKTSVRPRLASRSVARTVRATERPSGETWKLMSRRRATWSATA